jgi:hypothetical protein
MAEWRARIVSRLNGRALIAGLATAGLVLGVCVVAANRPTTVSVNVDVDLQNLHPAASQGALNCGAVVQSHEWIGAHRADLTDYDALMKWVLYSAHYLGQDRLVTFPVSARRYSGTVHVELTLSPTAFVDPATHAAWSPAPQVLVACWLMINGRPAVWDHSGATLLASAANFTAVTASPLVATTASAAPSSAISLAAGFKNQGHFFVPAPLALTANIHIGGAKSGSPGPSSMQTARAAPPPRKSPPPQQGPVPLVVQTQLDARGGFVAPAVEEIQTPFNSAGGFVGPVEQSVSGQFSGSGQFVAPTAVTVPTTLTAGGNFSTGGP